MSVTLSAANLLTLCETFKVTAHQLLTALAEPSVGLRAMETQAAAEVAVTETRTSVIFATKKTASFAAEHPEIKLEEVEATGHAGKVTLKDLKKAIKGTKKKKAKRDPNLPKRALNAYMFYLGARRAAFAAEHSELNGKQVTAGIAKEWRGLEDKSEWNAKAEADKARYVKAMAAYNAGEKAEETKVEVAKETKAEKAKVEFAKIDAKAAKVQTKVDGIVEEILSYVKLNKLNAADEKALRARVKDVDEHCNASLIDGVTMKEMKSILKEQKALQRKLEKGAKKAKKAKKAIKKVKIPKEIKTEVLEWLTKNHGEKWMELENKEELKKQAIEAIQRAKEEAAKKKVVSFDDVDSDSDEELEEDEAEEFEYKGKTYWRTEEGFVMEEEDGCFIGTWKDGKIVFDE